MHHVPVNMLIALHKIQNHLINFVNDFLNLSLFACETRLLCLPG